MIAELINREIRSTRIPPFVQCLPEVKGCAHLTNIILTYYQCPQRVIFLPMPYDRFVLSIKNFALGLTGNLGGQITVLLPLPLCGLICLDARQISVTVQTALTRNYHNGAVRLDMDDCAITIGYLNIYILGGGLVGSIVNNNFRGKIIAQVREMLIKKICFKMKSVLTSKVNSLLTALPQKISIMHMISFTDLVLQKHKKLPEYVSIYLYLLFLKITAQIFYKLNQNIKNSN
ncbi:unnamed protein product [Thelazia callipaeda]|uniref:BPI1 domain-containing protein n=1 Tax=Thelazia callipaeda TaxID=103827 RepID=A0A0N5D2D1_THECL|nr:unnamed protein product [Thelazia callipaeda]